MKKNYMRPLTEVAETQAMNTYLLIASENGNNILGSGGSSSDGNVTSSDSRERGTRNTDSFEDLW